MKTIIENVRFIQDGTMVFGNLHLENGYVERLDYKTPRAQQYLAIPGFVDLHTHGIHGYSTQCLDVQALREMALEYASIGVTSFAPTLRARPLQEYIPFIEAYRSAFGTQYKGARYVGLHLEGPYLNPEACGDMDGKVFQEVDLEELEAFLSAYHEDIAIMTIAPEVKHAMEAIHLLHLYGVEVSLGHTCASYETCVEAFREGATQITHLCNSMPALDHHQRNMMDAIFLSDCACTVILDRAHISDEMLKWMIRLLGSQRVIAISNGNERTRDIKPTLLDMFRDLYEDYGLTDALQMCSINAATMLKSYTHQISLGRKIDLVVLNEHLEIVDVLIDGYSMIKK